GRHARLGELGALGQKSIAGEDGLRAGRAGRLQDAVDAQVAVRGLVAAQRDSGIGLAHVRRVAVGVGMHGHAPDAQALERANGAHGDLAAVGDEYGVEHYGYSPWWAAMSC